MKSVHSFTIDSDVLKAARESGLNMSEICEQALRVACQYEGSPDEVNTALTSQIKKLEREKADLEARQKAVVDRVNVRHRILANKNCVMVLQAWKRGEAKDQGVKNTIKRTYGFVPDTKFIKELADEAGK